MLTALVLFRFCVRLIKSLTLPVYSPLSITDSSFASASPSMPDSRWARWFNSSMLSYSPRWSYRPRIPAWRWSWFRLPCLQISPCLDFGRIPWRPGFRDFPPHTKTPPIVLLGGVLCKVGSTFLLLFPVCPCQSPYPCFTHYASSH